MMVDRPDSLAHELRILRKLIGQAEQKLAHISRSKRGDPLRFGSRVSCSDDAGPAVLGSGEDESGKEENSKFEAMERDESYKILSGLQCRIFRKNAFGSLDFEILSELKRSPIGERLKFRTISLANKILGLVGARARIIRAANRARDAGDFMLAARLYGDACAAMPGYFEMWVQQGNMAKDARLLSQAHRAYKAALRLRYDDPDVYLQMGHLQKLTGNSEAAAQAYAVALFYAPDHADAQRELEAFGYSGLDLRIRAGA